MQTIVPATVITITASVQTIIITPYHRLRRRPPRLANPCADRAKTTPVTTQQPVGYPCRSGVQAD